MRYIIIMAYTFTLNIMVTCTSYDALSCHILIVLGGRDGAACSSKHSVEEVSDVKGD